jgi:hypothetical protein
MADLTCILTRFASSVQRQLLSSGIDAKPWRTDSKRRKKRPEKAKRPSSSSRSSSAKKVTETSSSTRSISSEADNTQNTDTTAKTSNNNILANNDTSANENDNVEESESAPTTSETKERSAPEVVEKTPENSGSKAKEEEPEKNDGEEDETEVDEDVPEKSSSAFKWVVLGLLGICFYVLHVFVSAPIRTGHVVAPGMWLSRCGIWPFQCEGAYLHVRHDGNVILYNANHEPAWEMPGKPCPSDRPDCVPGLDDHSLEIGGSKVNNLYVFQNGPPVLSPWPFQEKPKIKRVQRKYKLQQ